MSAEKTYRDGLIRGANLAFARAKAMGVGCGLEQLALESLARALRAEAEAAGGAQDSWTCPGCSHYTGHAAGCAMDVEQPIPPPPVGNATGGEESLLVRAARRDGRRCIKCEAGIDHMAHEFITAQPGHDGGKR